MIHRSFYVPLKVVTREQIITNSAAVSTTLSLPSSELNGKQRWEAITCVCCASHIMFRPATAPLKRLCLTWLLTCFKGLSNIYALKWKHMDQCCKILLTSALTFPKRTQIQKFITAYSYVAFTPSHARPQLNVLFIYLTVYHQTFLSVLKMASTKLNWCLADSSFLNVKNWEQCNSHQLMHWTNDGSPSLWTEDKCTTYSPLFLIECINTCKHNIKLICWDQILIQTKKNMCMQQKPM